MKQNLRWRARLAAFAVVALTAGTAIAGIMTAGPSSAQSCGYPFDNCPTTSTSPTTAPPSSTSTTATTNPGCGHGQADEHNPHCTTTTQTPQTTPENTTSTTAQSGGQGLQLVLVLNIYKSTVSVVVQVKVCNADPGSPITITFNGQQVAATTASQSIDCSSGFALGSGSSPGVVAAMGPLGRLLSSHEVAAPSAGSQTTFTVPSVPPGNYLVCAQSPGKDAACTNYTVSDSTSVLGTSFGGGPGAAPLVSASNPNSFLAFTGMGLLRLVLLALVLIATGGYLVKRNSRNNRRHHRRPSAA